MLTVFQATKSSCPGLESQSSAVAIATASAAVTATASASISVHKTDPPNAAYGDDVGAGLARRHDVAGPRAAEAVRRRGIGGAGRRLRLPGAAPTMTQQGAALQNYNNELVKCELRAREAAGCGRGSGRPTREAARTRFTSPALRPCPVASQQVGLRSSRARSPRLLSSRPL